MERPPLDEPFYTPDSPISTVWTRWMNKLWIVGGSVDNSGTTVQRPAKNLFIGRPYFDTDLGKPIWLKSANPSVWVDSSGTSI